MDIGVQWTVVENGKQTMVDNEQWWTIGVNSENEEWRKRDNGGQKAMVDNRQWWIMDDGG